MHVVGEVYGTFAFCKPALQLYHALRQEGYLAAAIPVMEWMMDVFRDTTFMNPDSLPRKGQYGNHYQQSYGVSSLHIAQQNNPARAYRSKFLVSARLYNNKKKSAESQPIAHSLAYDILSCSDLAEVSDVTMDVAELLQAVEAVVNEELFETKVLSADMLVLCCRLYELFLALRDRVPAISRVYEPTCQSLREEVHHGEPSGTIYDHVVHLQGLESSVLKTTFPVLDGDRSTDPNRIMHCRLVADVMVELLSKVDVDRDFLTIPNSPDVVSRVFGHCAVPRQPVGSPSADVMGRFHHYQSVFEAGRGKGSSRSAGVVSSARISEFKAEVLANPGLLGVFEYSGPDALCTLLDYVLAGAVGNLELAEWLVAMGGCHLRHNHSDPRGMSHLQVACRHGSFAMVDLVYHATQGCDIDVQNEEDGNTALHYAALRGDERMVNYLFMRQATPTLENRRGKTAQAIVKEKRMPAWVLEVGKGERALMPPPPPSSGKKVPAAAPSAPAAPSAADIQRAEKAREELFAMLDAEKKPGKEGKGKKKKK